MRTLTTLALLIIFNACDNDSLRTANELKGAWEWTGSCSVVGCLSPDEYGPLTLVITESTYDYYAQDTLQYSTSYTIKNDSTSGNSRLYEVELGSTGDVSNVTVINNSMQIRSYGFWESSFTRLEQAGH